MHKRITTGAVCEEPFPCDAPAHPDRIASSVGSRHVIHVELHRTGGVVSRHVTEGVVMHPESNPLTYGHAASGGGGGGGGVNNKQISGT